jgi:hypothetical protein
LDYVFNSLNVEGSFGFCPECGKTDGYVNIGRNHWFVCDAHKTRWRAGWNLFSSWREESEKDWEANWVRIKDYDIVQPARLGGEPEVSDPPRSEVTADASDDDTIPF